MGWAESREARANYRLHQSWTCVHAHALWPILHFFFVGGLCFLIPLTFQIVESLKMKV